MTDLDELERLLREATAGPWENYGMFPHCFEVCMAGDYATKPVCASPKKANADAIVALRNSAEALIRDARRYRDLLAAARQSLLALAHASEYNPRYIRDYERLSDAIDAAIAEKKPCA